MSEKPKYVVIQISRPGPDDPGVIFEGHSDGRSRPSAETGQQQRLVC